MARKSTNTSNKKSSSGRLNQKTPQKKSAALNTKTKNSENKTSKKNYDEAAAVEKSVIFNIMPFILFIISVYILVTFFISGDKVTENVGGVGVFIRNVFYGLLGFIAILLPVFTSSVAFFLKRDVKSGFLKYRIIFSVICIVLYASMFHLASKESADAGYNISRIFDNGKLSIGGGIFGGYLAETLRRCVGTIGAWIFTIPLSVVFSIFLFGYTPAEVLKFIIKLIREYKLSRPVKEYDEDEESGECARSGRINHQNIITPANKTELKKRARNFQVDIPLDSEVDSGKIKKKSRKDIEISDNPFANDFSEETEKTNENIEIQRSYETPLMLPSEDLFDSGVDINIKADADFADFDFDFNFDESTDLNKAVEAAEFSELEEGKEDTEIVGDIKIIDSAPQIRGDEPDISESKNAIKFETSKIFGETEELPVKREYKLPPISYLTKDTSTVNVDISEELHTTAQKLIDTLKSFGVKTKIYGYSRGPSITRYEISPDAGTKVNSIVNLVNDISLNLAAEVRIEAPIPGKSAIGVEVPNKIRETVYLRSLLEEPKFINTESKIIIALGKDVAGNAIYSDIAKMPHLLIAGATGMGKSICMNAIIASILYKATPDEVKLILVDPKKVELNMYNGIPHLLVPVVSDPKKAAGALAWAVNEMENRYILIEEKGVRNLKAYNEAIAGDPLAEHLPQIVIIVDELADMMLTAPADVEQSINRLAAKARAAGIHLIIATQRPSVDVITGLIKANIPTRIAFTVVSQIDSRTIINMAGAEKLIGVGDMLYVPTGSKPIRVQGAFISDSDTLNVIDFWKKQSDGQYNDAIVSEIEQEAARCNTKGAKIKDNSTEVNDEEELEKEPMLKPAIELAIDIGTMSTSLLMRKLSLGYGRAGRIVDRMEKMRVIGPYEGSKPRKVLITREEFIEMTMKNNSFE